MLPRCLGQALIRYRKEHAIYNKKKKANCFGNILRKNCLLRHVTEGNIEAKTEG